MARLARAMPSFRQRSQVRLLSGAPEKRVPAAPLSWPALRGKSDWLPLLVTRRVGRRSIRQAPANAAASQASMVTPFQNATLPAMFLAAGFGLA